MILQAVTDVSGSGVCLSYIALGGILFLGVGLGFAICTLLSRDPKADLTASLITNADALRLIDNYKSNNSQNNSVSGHFELGVIVGYIDKMKTACSSAGKNLSGLEFYFARYGQSDTPDQNTDTIVIYPTYEDNGKHIPFDPDLNVTVKDLNVDYQTDKASPANLSASKYTSTNVLNRAHMSPPREPLTL